MSLSRVSLALPPVLSDGGCWFELRGQRLAVHSRSPSRRVFQIAWVIVRAVTVVTRYHTMFKPPLTFFSILFFSVLWPCVNANTEIVNFDATSEPGTLIPWTSRWHDIAIQYHHAKSINAILAGQYLAKVPMSMNGV